MKIKNIITIILCGLFIFGFSCCCFFVQTPDYSQSERRLLADFPQFSWQNLTSGKFAKDFEEYATDRFVFRDNWRSVKAYTRLGLFLQKDNNDYIVSDGHIAKLDYPQNDKMLDHSISVFTNIKDRYLHGNNIYLTVIPDKNNYLAELKFDFNNFEQYMQSGMSFATPVSIADLLSADDYYFTDSHWRQENICDVANRIATSMGVSLPTEYKTNTLDISFYGVYAGHSALNCSPDTIRYLTNDIIDNLQVEGDFAIYDMNKLNGKDSYEFFLSGNQSVVKITNPTNQNGKHLVIFRDSFGCAIAPLLAQGYSQVTLIDLRYIQSELLGEYVDFEGADVLFLYSSSMLNNSSALK